MSRVKGISGILIVVLVFITILSACGGGNNNGADNNSSTKSTDSSAKTTEKTPEKAKEKVVLNSFDWTEPNTSRFQVGLDLVAEFNARDDVNATIKDDHLNSTAFYPKLNAMIAGNEAPDVYTLHGAGKMKTYADAGKLVELTDYLNADPEWKDSFISGAFSLMTFDEKVYGVPVSFSAATLYYNKEIFDKYSLQPPATYNDLKEVIKVLTANNVTPIAMAAKDAWVSALFSELVANRIGGDAPFDAIMNGGGTWLDPSFIEMGYVMQELVGLKAFPEGFLSLDNTGMTSMFKNGEAAMMVTGSWGINQVVADDSKIKDVAAIAKFPVFENGKGSADTWLGQPGFNFVISEKSKDKEASLEYIKMWTNNKYQVQVGEIIGDLPATKVTLDPMKVPELSKSLKKEMSTMTSMFIFYDVGLGAKIGDEYNNTIQEILAGVKPEEAFKNLQQYTEDNRE
jgi:raffinose/stachyose/melibiose transport system substrate-binding protein